MEENAVVDRVEDADLAVLLVGDAQFERVAAVGQFPPGAEAGSWLWVRFEGDQLIAAMAVAWSIPLGWRAVARVSLATARNLAQGQSRVRNERLGLLRS